MMTVLTIFAAAAVTLIALGATAMTAAADASVRLLGRGRIRRLADSGARGARALDSLSERPGRVAAVHALVSGASFALLSAVGAVALAEWWSGTPGWAVMIAAASIATVGLFVFGEALPRALASANPEDAGLTAAPFAARVGTVAFPIARLLSWPWRWTVTLVSGERSPEVPWVEAEEARATEDAVDGGMLSDDARGAVSDLGGKIVREIMVPRTDIVALEDTATIEDAVSTVTGAGVSRIPVYHETLDDITGVLYAKDLLGCSGEESRSRLVTENVREPFFVPETKPVEELLREMRRRTHIAIVLDEYGGTSGIVTIEDLVEEIVGEIYDEYDQQVQMVTDMGEGRYTIDARLPVDDLNELLGTALEVEADTAGGLVSELAGHIPDVGESVEVDGLRIVVTDKEGNRVRQLVVEPKSHARDGKDPS